MSVTPVCAAVGRSQRGRRQPLQLTVYDERLATGGGPLLGSDDSRVAVAARQLADALKIALDVDRRGVAADLTCTRRPAAAPIAFHRVRSIPGVDQLLDETFGAVSILERGHHDRIAAALAGAREQARTAGTAAADTGACG